MPRPSEHELPPGPAMESFNTTTIRPMRWWSKWSRNYLYGLSRMNEWPLWASWLLAPNAAARRRVVTLMEIKKGGSS